MGLKSSSFEGRREASPSGAGVLRRKFSVVCVPIEKRPRWTNAGCLYTAASAQTFAGHPMRFIDLKTETLNLRVSPSFKQVLKEAADHEQRSMVNMLEVLLGDYCDRKGIVSAGSKATPTAHKRARADRRAQVGAAA